MFFVYEDLILSMDTVCVLEFNAGVGTVYHRGLTLKHTRTVGKKKAYLKGTMTLRGKPKPSASRCQVHFIPDEKGFLNLSTSRELIKEFHRFVWVKIG